MPTHTPLSRFSTALVFEPLEQGKRRFKLHQDLVFIYVVDSEFVKLCVPTGFVTDLASVPRALWWLYPPHGKYTRAAVLHDYLYNSGKYSREVADEIFRAAMHATKVDIVTQILFYKGVRAFGKSRFKGSDND